MQRPSPWQRGAQLGTPGAVRSFKPGRARSHHAWHASQAPLRRACGVPGRSGSRKEEREREEGGAPVVHSPGRRAAVGFQAPAGHALVTHFSAALSCRITTSSVHSTTRERGTDVKCIHMLNVVAWALARTLLRTMRLPARVALGGPKPRSKEGSARLRLARQCCLLCCGVSSGSARP